MHLRGRAPALAMIVAGVLLLGAALWWIGQNRTHPAAFDEAPPSAAVTASTVAGSHTASVATSSGKTTAPTTPPATPQSPAPVSATGVVPPTGAPIELTVAALGVRAPVDPVLNAGGVLRPPDDPARLGWWIGSALPGAGRGGTVIAGHVDSAQDGPGALYRLADVPAGAEISVRATGGAPVVYRVTARQFYAKSQGLPADLFSFGGPPRLVLITCGGEFDETTGNYEENVVVTADPA